MKRAIKLLGKDALVYGLAGGISRFVKVLLVPVVAKAFPAATYGVFDSLGVYTYLFAVIGVLGLDAAVILFAKPLPGEPEQGRRSAASEALLLVVSVSTGLALAIVLARDFWNSLLLGGGPFASAIGWAGATVPFASVLVFALSLLKWEFRQAWYLVASLGSVVASIGLTWIVAYHTPFGLPGLFAATAAGQAVGTVLALAGCRDLFGPLEGFRWAKPMLRVGIPFAVIGAAAAFTPSIDRFFVLRLHSLAEAGLYGVGQKIAALMALLMAGFQAAWGPFAVSHRDAPDRDAIFGRVLLLVAVWGVWLVAVLSLIGPRLAVLAATNEYAGAGRVVPPLALAATLAAIYFIVSIGAFLEGRTVLNLVAYAAGILVTIGLNLAFMVTRTSAMYIAWANCAGQAAAVALMCVLSHRVLPIAFPYARAAGVVVMGALLGTVAAAVAPLLKLSTLVFLLLLTPVAFGMVTWWGILLPAERRALRWRRGSA